MSSIKVRDFAMTVENYVDTFDLPMEVKRLALMEVYQNIKEKAESEIYKEALQRSQNNQVEQEDKENV